MDYSRTTLITRREPGTSRPVRPDGQALDVAAQDAQVAAAADLRQPSPAR